MEQGVPHTVMFPPPPRTDNHVAPPRTNNHILPYRSRGFGFITFGDASSVEKVIAVANHVLDGKKIDPKHATPKNRGRSNRTKKIFVGGVSQDTSAEEVKQFFSQFGKVEETVMLMDNHTKRHRGFGFVTFECEDVVERVCDIHFHSLKNKKVECKKAQPKEAVQAATLMSKRFMVSAPGMTVVARAWLLMYSCTCMAAHVQLHVHGCSCTATRAWLLMYSCTCMAAHVQLHVHGCSCTAARAWLLMYSCTCMAAHVQLHVHGCSCTAACTRMDTRVGVHDCINSSSIIFLPSFMATVVNTTRPCQLLDNWQATNWQPMATSDHRTGNKRAPNWQQANTELATSEH
ncbi:RNA recognition motif domain [Trinorchestia longiramus]|nr:RNA recognition motif domain [Trinorchestia longiramus]